jgi:hypothetical protein
LFDRWLANCQRVDAVTTTLVWPPFSLLPHMFALLKGELGVPVMQPVHSQIGAAQCCLDIW